MMNKKSSFFSQISPWFTLSAQLGLAFMMTSCLENTGSKGASVNQASSFTPTTTASSSVPLLVISNVTIASSGTSVTTSAFSTSIFFDTAKSTTQISNFCGGQSSSTSSSTQATNSCVCNFSWVENNTTSGTTVPVQRGVQTAVQTVQSSLVTCAAPDAYSNNEIVAGTVIQISVLPGPNNTATFPMSPFSYTRSNSVSTGSFQDSQGNSFQNILRYSCYQQFQRGMTVSSQLLPIANPSNGAQIYAPMANQFCVQKINGVASSAQGCQGQLPPPDFSAQANYFNLYIRDSEQGDINYGNQSYSCPVVKEALGNNGSVGTQNKPWPLDRTFALSLSPTTQFTVGVEAFSRLSNGSDPTAVNTSCYPSTGAQSTTNTGGNTLIRSCLGFASIPNTDGTCPYFRDANNAIRFTYRLRRYIAIYPPLFDTDGQPLSQAQSSDTIYVLDRPVNGPNPLAPYTMAGPKPCPFAYFDHSGVTQVFDANYPSTNYGRPGYYATNDSIWSGKNVDGIEFPNKDAVNSCSAAIPLINHTKSNLSLGTVNALNPYLTHLYIRPTQPWGPHYIEDSSFQACAPLASPLQDPPLHFAKDSSGNVGWCAEVYPTQNGNISLLEPVNTSLTQTLGAAQYAGGVIPYTSHTVKNTSSAPCAATTPGVPTSYPTPAACTSSPAPISVTGTVTLSSAQVTAVSSINGIVAGQAVSGGGIPAGAVVAPSPSPSASTFAISATATATHAGETITINNVGTVATGSNQITSAAYSGFAVGLTISDLSSGAGHPYIPVGTQITAISGSTITLSNSATAAGTIYLGVSKVCGAYHYGATTTCDRTVNYQTPGTASSTNTQMPTWGKFPLLAPASNVESAIQSDISNYGCLLTYDGGGAKTGKNSPTGGCCGSAVKMTSGLSGSSNAHLEPDVSCLTPNY